MNICVIYPQISKESAEELAKNLNADCINPFRTKRRDFREYDVVFNYGCNREIYAKKVINAQKSVATCVDKVKTFEIFHANQIPTVGFHSNKHLIPDAWNVVVCRPNAKSAQGKDIIYWNRDKPIPDAQLYTEYFDHSWEYRIVVFMGKIVGRYRKDHVDDGSEYGKWILTKMLKKGFETIDDACVRASKALTIDYVGFDVLEDQTGRFVLLEANTGPTMTVEMNKAVVKYFKELK